jgi:MoaE-MoaD fusion protein
MSLHILFFASLREKIHTARLDIDWLSGESADGLKARLAQLYPALQPLIPSALVAINQEFIEGDKEIPDEVEVAFFPPVSGGSDLPSVLGISQQPIDVNQVVQRIALPSTGAIVTFTGLVRAETKRGIHQKTDFLEYEAYEPMAVAKIKQIEQEMRAQWPDVVGIVMIQRVGHLDIGETAVVVACSAGHRDSGAFEAARYGIDRLKEIVPVWKKESGPDGEVWVEGDYHPKEGD